MNEFAKAPLEKNEVDLFVLKAKINKEQITLQRQQDTLKGKGRV